MGITMDSPWHMPKESNLLLRVSGLLRVPAGGASRKSGEAGGGDQPGAHPRGDVWIADS